VLREKEVFGKGLSSGWVELQTSSPAVWGGFFLSDPQRTLTDGTELLALPANRIIFPKTSTNAASDNQLVFINTTDRLITEMTVSLFENSGQRIAQHDMSLGPFAGWTGSISDLMPSVRSFDGYAVVETNSSEDALIGFETFRNQSDVAVLAAIPDMARLRTGYLPQIGNQPRSVSTLVLVNYGNGSQNVKIGEPGKAAEWTVVPNERLEVRLDQALSVDAALTTPGYIRFETESGLFAYLESKNTNGNWTAVRAQESGYRDITFSHIENGPSSYTGLTLINVNPRESFITIDAFDSEGNARGTGALTLAPDSYWSGFVSDLLPDTENQIGGGVHIRASSPILATGAVGLSSSSAMARMPAHGDLLAPDLATRADVPYHLGKSGFAKSDPDLEISSTLNAISPGNSAPVVYAGPDQVIKLPSAAPLYGQATDDGLPAGSTLTMAWSKVSGPGPVSFSPQMTAVAFTTPGTYVLRLTATDGLLSASDDVMIVVNPCGVAVSGIIKVLANATDNVGVAGVQFKRNGVNWGTELRTAPYSITWDTRYSANGCYTVSATARDAAGNKRTANFLLTVSNLQ
jgi:hypothetical protein